MLAPVSTAAPAAPTIFPRPNPATADEAVSISGRAASSTVALWQEIPPSTRFHRIATAGVDPSGRYKFVRRAGSVSTNRSWYVTAGRQRSRTVNEKVQAVVTLTASDLRPLPGERVHLKGRVTPSHAGETITYQEAGRAGAWKTIGSSRLSPGSTFDKALTLSRAGGYGFRAVLPADTRNVTSTSPTLALEAIQLHKIKHVVIIMQENRSFDEYFGTFPGADGIPGLAGNRGTVPCIPDPLNGGCDAPYHDRQDVNYGGPHSFPNAQRDMDCSQPGRHIGCHMDGFVGEAETGQKCTGTDPSCSPCTTSSVSACIDVMGYHTRADIPNYWRYAHDFVLQDRMYEPNSSWSLPAHMYMVSEWAAHCDSPYNPFSCASSSRPGNPVAGVLSYAWTDLTYLLHKAGVSWRYYIFKGNEPDCEIDSQMRCKPVHQGPKTPSIWNPLPAFTDVTQDGQLNHIQGLNVFFKAANAGRLPAVSWIVPQRPVSDHPPGLVSAAQTYVTGLINTIMNSPDWSSTAIFLSWDDWGGFYDSLVPPVVDPNGYGLRVPGIMISPYAKRGLIDHQVLSFDAYVKLIEDDFLNGQRLDPTTDGRPDPRPSVRENLRVLGNLQREFSFTARPRKPVILPVCPATDLQPTPSC
jgi:phospholipase C